MFFPPKYVKFKSGLIALEPHSGAHLSIVSKFPNQSPESAGFVSLGREGYRFGGQSLTLKLHADADTSLDGDNLFYIFTKNYWDTAGGFRLSTVLNQREEAMALAEKNDDSLVYEGVWKEVQLPEYSVQMRLCLPVADHRIDANAMARELQVFFSEIFPPSVFDSVVE